MVRFSLKLWWVIAVGVVCVLMGGARPVSWAIPSQASATQPSAPQSAASNSATPSTEQQPKPHTAPAPKPSTPTLAKPQAKPKHASTNPATPKKAAGAPSHSSTAHRRAAIAQRRRGPVSPRVRRMRQAFVASASLRPMAQQLEQDRTPAAYAGVEVFARSHAKEDAGALAWLVDGYAHVLDHDYTKAIDPLNRAKPMAGDLGDYVDYYLGTSYLQTGHDAEALATLVDFDRLHPDSLLVRDAHLAYAETLAREGRSADAAALLEKDRIPARSDIELAIGKAYAAAGENAKAAEALANVYYNMPTSAEADAAYAELKKLPALPAATVQQRKTRGDLLMKAHRYSDAVDAYRDLVNASSPADRPAAQIALAEALHHANRDRDARTELALLAASGDPLREHRLFILSEIEWSSGNNDAFYRAVNELREAPQNPWLEQALLSAANLHLVHHEYDQALATYGELQQRYPTGAHASYVHWRAAWLTLREGRNADAEKLFEDQITLYPAGGETSAALYWRARLAEEDQQLGLARAIYQKLSQRYLNYYYADLGRQRLKSLPASAEVSQHYTLLDHVPAFDGKEKVEESEPPTDDLHWQKAELLGNGGLVDFAVRELQAAPGAAGSSWAPAESAKLYADNGQFDRAIELMKHAAPSYFAVDLPDLPRAYWEALFPKPYWADLKRYAAENGLDPYLVASLIRQESEFNPNALSRANAVGLMQLLPKTGKQVAKQEKLKRYNPSQLYTPAVNLELGTRYFRGMVDRYAGALEYALAAYNAGTERVTDWVGQGTYRDPQEFVESIPFTETREYVQAILRNASLYKQLYGTP